MYWTVGTLLDSPEELRTPVGRGWGGQGGVDGHGAPWSSVNYMQLLTEKYGEDMMEDGRPMHEDPQPIGTVNEISYDLDNSVSDINNLQGERVDPHLRIKQVDKLLAKSDNLSIIQRRSLVSRRNTAKLRLRQKNEREYANLIHKDLDIIQEAVSCIHLSPKISDGSLCGWHDDAQTF